MSNIIAGLFAVLLLVMVVALRRARRAEVGTQPHYTREVFYSEYAGLPAADPRQIRTYFAEGGAAFPHGTLVYGVKPAPHTPGVMPFGARHWFHPIFSGPI